MIVAGFRPHFENEKLRNKAKRFDKYKITAYNCYCFKSKYH